MAKVGQYVYFDIGDFQAIEEIRSMCKLKNFSQTIHFVLQRYRKLEEEQRNLRKLVQENKQLDYLPKIEHRKPINPMVNP